jgi:molecular chaperone GrpE
MEANERPTDESRDSVDEVEGSTVIEVNELEEMKKEVKKSKEEAQDFQNKLKYLLADFDNYRKQIDKQATMKREVDKSELLLKVIQIYDEYVAAMPTIEKANCSPTVLEGLNSLLKNFENLLKLEGVSEIEDIGTDFDPNIHDAISYKPIESDIPDNTIIEVVRKGYMLNDKILRPSLVILSKKIVKNKDTNYVEKE